MKTNRVPIHKAVVVAMRLNAMDFGRTFYVDNKKDGTGLVYYDMGGIRVSVFIDDNGETPWDRQWDERRLGNER